MSDSVDKFMTAFLGVPPDILQGQDEDLKLLAELGIDETYSSYHNPAHVEAAASGKAAGTGLVNSPAPRGVTLNAEQRMQLDGMLSTRLNQYDKALEQRDAALVSNEPAPSVEDIQQAVFGHLPDSIKPPRVMAELQDWRMVRDAMADRSVAAMAEKTTRQKVQDGADTLGTALGGLSTAGNVVGKAVGALGGDKVTKIADGLAVLQKVVDEMNYAAPIPGGLVSGTLAARDDYEENNVKLKMQQDEMLRLLTDVAAGGVDLAAEFIPYVSLVKNGADLMKAGVQLANRLQLQYATGTLETEASADMIRQLSKAFGQAKTQERTLAAKAGLDATTNAIGLAGGIASATVVGEPVGKILAVVKGVASGVGKAGFFVWDQVAADKAVATLNAARAGDVVAQKDVFANHAHYAKMLICLWAKKEDRLAVKYLVDRGLSEADLSDKGTTAGILFDYAVSNSGETDAPKTIAQKMSSLKQTIGGLFDALLARLTTSRDTVEPDGPDISQPLEIEANRLYAEFQKASAALKDVPEADRPEASSGVEELIVAKLPAVQKRLHDLIVEARQAKSEWFERSLNPDEDTGFGRTDADRGITARANKQRADEMVERFDTESKKLEAIYEKIADGTGVFVKRR